ncbi:MAG TPA: peptidoglycan DD-metalloendopeptidase family protein [bacterium]|nr:peptidoglycan DD-metalloendopeptidase family protein [Myxococcales bacterium]HQG12952.1 peptidoglycan DD-metalloendopeptidase family protein [bacterium]HQH80865.1 peptidoglycan DD-metalloendopeptidase family protein [bacterium]
MMSTRQLRGTGHHRKKKIGWRILFLALVATGAAFLGTGISKVIIYLGRPELVEIEPTGKSQLEWIDYTVESGDTLQSIFARFGIDSSQGYAITNSLGKIWNLSKIRPGNLMEFGFDDNMSLLEFVYAASPVEVFQVKRIEREYLAKKLDVNVERRLSRIQFRLENSIYGDLVAIGELPSLVEKIVDIMAWDIDFFSDPRQGDLVTMLVEKNYVDGELYNYGRISAMDYDGAVVKQAAFYFETAAGDCGYFDEMGRSLARNFLKTPVKFTRISSKFGMRKHPVTHKMKHHYGTDYAAPTGTPVWAMSGGVVTRKTYDKYGGNMVVIKHAKGYETYYLHLSKFAPQVKPGVRVRQKDVIGYVGTTGRSTGPHLHLSIKQNGRHIDPLKVSKVKEITLAGADLERFKSEMAVVAAQLRGEEQIKTALIDLY